VSTARRLHCKRMALVNALFTVDRSDPVVRYFLRPGADAAVAAITWPDHGVCPHCHARGISAGQCKHCGGPLPEARSYATEWWPIARNAHQAILNARQKATA